MSNLTETQLVNTKFSRICFAGIHWRTLHVLDHSRYTSPRTDYIPLPQDARTHSTGLRWWQPPAPDGRPRPQWAIDDVLVGGYEINPSSFHQLFDYDTPQQVSCHAPSVMKTSFVKIITEQNSLKPSRFKIPLLCLTSDKIIFDGGQSKSV